MEVPMSGADPSRRQFLGRLSLAAGGAFLAPAVLAACGSSGGAGTSGAASAAPSGVNAKWPRLTSRQVVVAGFGGETYDVRQKVEFDPFTKLSGVRVVQAPWDYGKFVSMVTSAKPEWDMIDFDGYSIAALIEQGTPPAKLADWVRRCDLVDEKYRDYAGGSYAYSVVLGWSTKLGATPTGWADFFDTKKFPGKRAFPKSIYAGTAEIALLADGVAKDKIYPLDLDRALAKLDTIKSDLVFYDSYAQGQQYLVQGSASMIATANSRMIQLKNTGRPVDWTYQDAVLYPWGAFGMPQKPPNPDAANALIDYLSTPEAQAAVAKRLYLGPVVSAAFDMLTPAEKAMQPSAPENVAKQLSVDVPSLAKQDAEYVKKFFAWVGN
jgi:putative spermidine/putrescine transport system substrate-binding protein